MCQTFFKSQHATWSSPWPYIGRSWPLTTVKFSLEAILRWWVITVDTKSSEDLILLLPIQQLTSCLKCLVSIEFWKLWCLTMVRSSFCRPVLLWQGQHGWVVSMLDLQSGGPGFKNCSGHLLDLISVVPSLNPWPCSSITNCNLLPVGGFNPVMFCLYFVSNSLSGVPAN